MKSLVVGTRYQKSCAEGPDTSELGIKLNNKTSKRQLAGMDKPALKAFMDYQWPGNIRELANAVEHAFVLCSGSRIELQDLPAEIRDPSLNADRPVPVQTGPGPEPTRAKQHLSREQLLSILNACGWNKAEAARRTGYSRAARCRFQAPIRSVRRRWSVSQKSAGGSPDPVRLPPAAVRWLNRLMEASKCHYLNLCNGYFYKQHLCQVK